MEVITVRYAPKTERKITDREFFQNMMDEIDLKILGLEKQLQVAKQRRGELRDEFNALFGKPQR